MTVEPKNLIIAVEERPLLWDTTDENYKDKSKKDTAWIDVCLCLFEGFAEKPEPEQKLLLQDVKSRWRTVRDNYIRAVKKQAEYTRGSGTKKVKSYIYGKQLCFLKKNEETESKINRDPEKESFLVGKKEKSTTPTDVDLHHRNTGSFVTRKRTLCKKRKKIVGQMCSDFMPVLKLRRNTEMDEDLAFFYSLLPTVRSLNIDTKFAFRLQTMELLRNLKSSNSNFHQDNTSISNSDNE